MAKIFPTVMKTFSPNRLPDVVLLRMSGNPSQAVEAESTGMLANVTYVAIVPECILPKL
jgi:hypothetical protein